MKLKLLFAFLFSASTLLFSQDSEAKIEVLKKTENNSVILEVPNKKEYLTEDKIDSYLQRVNSLFPEVENMIYIKGKNHFNVVFKENSFPEQKGRLDEILIHFNIDNYFISEE